jgi:hypothetical protein
MDKVYLPHYPTRNSGFIIIAISIILFMLAIVCIVLGNIGPGWLVWLIAFLVMVGIWLGMLKAIAIALKNDPRKVTLTDERLIVETPDGKRELEIPFADIIAVNEGKAFIVDVDDPQYEKYKLWYRGLVIDWLDGETERRDHLSERNTAEFDELMDDVFNRAPEPTRGPRFYER